MAAADLNLEWLGYLQPTGLALSPAVLDRYSLLPEEQTRADGEAVLRCLTLEQNGRRSAEKDTAQPALADAWTFFSTILDWRPRQVAGLPGGTPLPGGVSLEIEEAETTLEPHWAVIDPEDRTTLLVRIEAPGVAPTQRGALSGWEASPHQRFERLLRETGVGAGLLVTDRATRAFCGPVEI